jgi:hypothetical protein
MRAYTRAVPGIILHWKVFQEEIPTYTNPLLGTEWGANTPRVKQQKDAKTQALAWHLKGDRQPGPPPTG